MHDIHDKTIKYQRKVVCHKCHGAGGEVEVCKHCGGSGFITKTLRKGNAVYQQMTPCTECKGSGHKVKSVCTECHGKGYNIEDAEFKVTILQDDLLQNNIHLYVGDYGHITASGKSGPLIIAINHQLPVGMSIIRNSMFSNAYNVLQEIEIPYYDMILGTKYEVTNANGKKIAIKIPENCTDRKSLIAKGQGFNGGAYILTPKVVIKDITDEERKLIEKIKELKNKTT